MAPPMHVARWAEEVEYELASLYDKYAERMIQKENSGTEVRRVLAAWDEFTNIANGVLLCDLNSAQFKSKIDNWRVSFYMKHI